MSFSTPALVMCIAFAGACVCFAQGKPFTPDVSQINDPNAWRLINAQTRTGQEDGAAVAHLDPIGGNTAGKSNYAMALLKSVPFKEGVIEIDLKGNGDADASFLGIAFNVVDEKTFEAVYFRPFNFSRDGFQNHAVQYIAQPDFPWKKLRDTKPGVYEAKVDPAPDPAKWFHARIDITAKKVSVWVDQSKQPCLVVDRLSGQTSGTIGLWVDSKSGAFRNLKLQTSR